MSNHQLLKFWPDFVTVRCIASFLGFMNFYSQYTPYFEQRASPLRALTKLDMDHTVVGTLIGKHKDFLKNLIAAITSDSCIDR